MTAGTPPVAPRTGTGVPARTWLSDAAVATGIGVVGAALLWIGSWVPSLWFDEAATASAVRRSPAELWSMLGTVDVVHGLYYFGMQAWTSVVGTSAAALRAPSAMAAGAAAAGTWLLGDKLLGRRGAWLGACVVLLLPRVTWAAVEGRSTALTILVAVWATLLLVLAVEAGSSRRLLFYGLVMAAGILLNIYLALLLLAHGVSVVLVSRDRSFILRWCMAAVAALTVAAPLVVEARRQAAQLGGVDLGMALMVRSVVVNQWFAGATPVQNGDGGGSPTRTGLVDALTTSWSAAAVAVAVVCWALTAVAVLRPTRRPAHPDRLAWLLPWLVVPSVVAVVFSAVVTPVYHPRYLAFCAPAVALLVASGLDRLRSRTAVPLVLVGLAALASVVAVSQRTATAKDGYDWAAAAVVLDRSARAGEGVYFAPRTAGASGSVVKSSRLLGAAYPEATAGLVDVTQRETATGANALMGVSYPIRSDAVMDRLASVDGLWVVRWRDYPAGAVALDHEVVLSAGLHEACRWEGPVTVVEHFVRDADSAETPSAPCPG